MKHIIIFVLILCMIPFSYAASLSPDQFLSSAKTNPNQYMVVVGDYAEDYELSYAHQLAQSLGIRVKQERDVFIDQNLIFVGSPSSNELLDKALHEPYTGKPFTKVSDKNLLIVFSSANQAPNIDSELLSPASNTFLFLILLSLIIMFSIGILEVVRHTSISKAKESHDTHKLDAIESYIRKYERQGHSAWQIQQWLIKYGYPPNLVQEAFSHV